MLSPALFRDSSAHSCGARIDTPAENQAGSKTVIATAMTYWIVPDATTSFLRADRHLADRSRELAARSGVVLRRSGPDLVVSAKNQ